MHFRKGASCVLADQEEGYSSAQNDKKQGEDERLLDSELFYGGLHLSQQSEVKCLNNEKPQSQNSQERILQVRRVLKELVYRSGQIQ